MDILNKFEETVRRNHMLKKGDKVIVGCSGGPDSVALLDLLNQIKEKYNLSLVVAHINHKLRRRESDEDESFVKGLARDLGLQFHSKSFDVKRIAKKRKLSIEEAAREVRYDYLNKLADRVKADQIALGHNADDQAETVLMRLIRGAGGVGLSGMPSVKGKLIRPLLEIKRKEIEQFLRQCGISFRIDSSNLRKDYLRNRVRLELMPYLRKHFNPNIVDTLNRTASILSAQEAYLKREIGEVFQKVATGEKEKISLDLDKLFNYDIFLRREMLRLAVDKIGGGFFRSDFGTVERILSLAEEKKTGRRVFLSKTILAEVSSTRLNLYKVKKIKKCQGIVLPGKVTSEEYGISIDSTTIEKKNLAGKPYSDDQMTAFLDWNKLKPPFILRNPKPGDRFRPLGMKGTKSLKDFLTDLKVPRYEKERVLLLTSRGKIVWVLGYRISDEFKVSKMTEKILKLETRKTGE